MELTNKEVLHSLSFRVSHYVDIVGFEMLTSDGSCRIKYTFTKGTGVLGKLIAKGKLFIPISDILTPTKLVRFASKKRLCPGEWYSIHVLIHIDSFNTSITTTGGCGGQTVVATESGVTVSYGEALETCSRTGVDSGQIGGIAFCRINAEEEAFLNNPETVQIKKSKPAGVEKKVCSTVQEECSVKNEKQVRISVPDTSTVQEESSVRNEKQAFVPVPETWDNESSPVTPASYFQAIHKRIDDSVPRLSNTGATALPVTLERNVFPLQKPTEENLAIYATEQDNMSQGNTQDLLPKSSYSLFRAVPQTEVRLPSALMVDSPLSAPQSSSRLPHFIRPPLFNSSRLSQQ